MYRRIFSLLSGLFLFLATFAAAGPVSAQVYGYYTCPPGYYAAAPNSCVPSGYVYGAPYFGYGVPDYGSFGFFYGWDHGSHHGWDRGVPHGFGHGGFGHGGGFGRR